MAGNLNTVLEGRCPTCAAVLERQDACGWCPTCNVGHSFVKNGDGTGTYSLHMHFTLNFPSTEDGIPSRIPPNGGKPGV